jgi:hypothetical protein
MPMHVDLQSYPIVHRTRLTAVAKKLLVPIPFVELKILVKLDFSFGRVGKYIFLHHSRLKGSDSGSGAFKNVVYVADRKITTAEKKTLKPLFRPFNHL